MELFETIEVPRPAAECFRYLLDFSRCEEWDPGVLSAARKGVAPLGVGAAFTVECALPIGSITLDYKTVQARENTLIKLIGTCRYFTVEDTIEFSEESKAGALMTRISYRAVFNFKQIPNVLLRAAAPGLRKVGKQAVDGLNAALCDDFPVPEQTALSELGDKLVLPGMAYFSRLGYTRARPHFNPMSADISGKRVLLTGASSGIGLAAAHDLARRGAELLLVVRDRAKGEKVVTDIKQRSGNSSVSLLIADMSLLDDVDSLVKTLRSRRKPIDILINNAGALFDEQRDTEEGFDESMALLLLAPYRLMTGLKPVLERADDPRVINVVSGGMYTQRLNLRALVTPPVDNYSGSAVYAQAKRALMIATEALAHDWENEGIVVNAMHPGWADTAGVRSALPEFYKLTKGILRTPQQGADTIIWLAVASEAASVSGELFLDRTPRDPYLIPGTCESESLRALLLDCLQNCKTRSEWELAVERNNTAFVAE